MLQIATFLAIVLAFVTLLIYPDPNPQESSQSEYLPAIYLSTI